MKKNSSETPPKEVSKQPLAETGADAGIELIERELEKVSGGFVAKMNKASPTL